MKISFTIPGHVRGKGRPKFRAVVKKDGTKFAHAYTDEKTVSAEGQIKTFAAAAMQGRAPLTGPLWLELRIQRVQPETWSKKKKAESFFVTGKPDLDNVLKLVGDALNKICWMDDAQLAAIFVFRTFGVTEEATVTFGKLEDELVIDRPNWAPKEMDLFASRAA